MALHRSDPFSRVGSGQSDSARPVTLENLLTQSDSIREVFNTS